ncbi:MAG TPA: AraC family transcriptional regulator [Nocardioides sp.]|jgi:AraC-like DNA-binding protein/mannose-6-phosphate isomerase-like protein (cupin superfamily)|uniref:helix-turn-helix domain-containing protein n=1 Tax=Nocardioides sp. TaxID=35761 RepID=UPI002E327993|nr:AraC family transcriptional regulator [Nocardioides sp.]HEX3931184.1 AraC family transcriptional regulator [Nocardioides sp.]
MWADVERFGIDALVAADSTGPRRRPRRFAVQVPELTSVEVHWHDYYELGVVLEGCGSHVVNGGAHDLGPGDAFLLSPADFHALEARTSLLMVNAVLHPELVEPTLETVRTGDPGLPWHAGELAPVRAAIGAVRREVARREPGWELVVESALTAALVGLARSCGDADTEREEDDQGGSIHLRRAVRYVEQHFREPLTLGQVAAVAHLSPHWFSEQFRRTTGDSFQSYLKRRRLRFARALLESTRLGVTEVGLAAGFGDPSYFGRAFRQEFGVPPSRVGVRGVHPDARTR